MLSYRDLELVFMYTIVAFLFVCGVLMFGQLL